MSTREERRRLQEEQVLCWSECAWTDRAWIDKLLGMERQIGHGDPACEHAQWPLKTHLMGGSAMEKFQCITWHIIPTRVRSHLAPPRTQRAAKALARLGPDAALIILARHGETDWNCEHRLQGQDPRVPGVNATGSRQAQAVRDAWGDRMNVTGCLPDQDARVPGVNGNGIDIPPPGIPHH